MNKLESVLDVLIANKCKSTQVALRGMPAPIGPGVLVHLNDVPGNEEMPRGLYQLAAEAHMGHPSSIPGMPPTLTAVRLPFIFSGDDVVWVSSGPVDLEGKPIVIDNQPAMPQGRGRGGLQLG